MEFLCNESFCWFGCYDRKNCYDIVSRQNLGEDCSDHVCVAPDSQSGFRFSYRAMENPAFISVGDIRNTYADGVFQFLRLKDAVWEVHWCWNSLLYYMTKPEYQIHGEKRYIWIICWIYSENGEERLKG